MDNQNFTTYRPLNNAEVTKFTVLAFFIAVVAIGSAVSAVLYHPLFIAPAGGALVGGIVLMWRINEHDRRAFSWRKSAPTAPPETTKIPETVIQPVTITDNTMRLGRFRFTAKEWKRLAAILQANNWRFIRDVVSQADIFPNITHHWPDVKSEFDRLGFLDGNELSETGRQWFEQLLPHHSPHPNGTH